MHSKIQRKLTTAKSLFNTWVVDGVLGEIPRLAFGNAAGFRNNMAPILTSASPRRLESAASGVQSVTVREVAELRREGYVLSHAQYDRRFIDDVIAKFQRLIVDPEHAKPNSKYSVELKNPLASIPEFAGLLNEPVRDLLRTYFGSPFKVIESQAFRTYPIPEEERAKEAYSNFWHCDGYPASWVKVYVFLSDWTPISGGTEILPIPATKRVIRSGYVNRYYSVGGEQRLQRLTAGHTIATGGAGSVFVFNPQRCLHRAGVPQDGRHRDAVNFFIAGTSDSREEPASWTGFSS